MTNNIDMSFSAEVSIEEKEVRLPTIPTLGTTKTGMVLNSNWGEAKKIMHIQNNSALLEFAGKPNKYNEKNWLCASDYFNQGASELYVSRPIPEDALNNSIKFTGNFKLNSQVITNQPMNAFYNKDVAKYSIERLHTVNDAELEIIHRYVTTKENTAVAICSDEMHWNQPVSNEEIDLIRDINMNYTPLVLINNETYQVKNELKNIIVDSGNTINSIVIEKPSVKLKQNDIIEILDATDNNNNNKLFTIKSFDETTNKIILSEGQELETIINDGIGKVKFISGKLTANFNKSFNYIAPALNTFKVVNDVTSDFVVETILMINEKFFIVESSVFDSGDDETTITVKGSDIVGNSSIVKIMEKSIDADVLKYNLVEKHFFKTSYGINKLVFIEKLGKTFKVISTSPLVLSLTNYEFLVVDENRDNKGEYAVRKIYKNKMYNSDRSLKTFAQIFDKKPVFNKDEFAIVVFEKSDVDGLFDIKERHIVSYDETSKTSSGRSKFVENVIIDESKMIYVKVGSINTPIEKIEFSTGKNYITVLGDFSHLKEYKKVEILESSELENNGIFVIDSVEYDEVENKSILFFKDEFEFINELTTNAKLKVSMGQVSTNRSETADSKSIYFVSNSTNPIIGKSINDLIIKEPNTSVFYKKDFSMCDVWEENANYGVLTEKDFNTAAELFSDKDKSDVQILISFLTKDENGLTTINKMSQIAKEREDCISFVGPFEEENFFGKTNEQIVKYLIENFGSQRDNIFDGQFTAFSSYAACYGNMKQIRNIYSDKDVWVSVLGDIAGMMTKLIATKGPWNALSGPENGVFLNAKQMIFNPNKDERNLLSKNSVNHIYFSREINRYIIFEQYTATLDIESLYRHLHIRTLANSLKEFLKRVLIFKLFKNNTDYERSSAIEKVTPVFESILNNGGIDFFNLICDDSNNTDVTKNIGDFVFDVIITPTKVNRRIVISLTSLDYGVNVNIFDSEE